MPHSGSAIIWLYGIIWHPCSRSKTSPSHTFTFQKHTDDVSLGWKLFPLMQINIFSMSFIKHLLHCKSYRHVLLVSLLSIMSICLLNNLAIKIYCVAINKIKSIILKKKGGTKLPISRCKTPIHLNWPCIYPFYWELGALQQGRSSLMAPV